MFTVVEQTWLLIEESWVTKPCAPPRGNGATLPAWIDLHKRCGVADDVGEKVFVQAPGIGKAQRMQEDDGAEFLCLCKGRFEAPIRQVHAVDMGADLDAAETERRHAVFQFGHCQLGRLQRHSPQRDEAVGMGIANFGQPRVDHAGCLAAQVGLDRVIVLQWRSRDRLHVDAHIVHVGEALFDGREFAVELGAQLVLVVPRANVGIAGHRIRLGLGGLLRKVVGGGCMHVAMRVNGKALVAALDDLAARGTGCRPITRRAGEQHGLPPRFGEAAMLLETADRLKLIWVHRTFAWM